MGQVQTRLDNGIDSLYWMKSRFKIEPTKGINWPDRQKNQKFVLDEIEPIRRINPLELVQIDSICQLQEIFHENQTYPSNHGFWVGPLANPKLNWHPSNCGFWLVGLQGDFFSAE